MLSFSYLRANTKLTFFGLLYLNFSFLGSNISWIQKVQMFLRFRGIYFSRNIFFEEYIFLILPKKGEFRRNLALGLCCGALRCIQDPRKHLRRRDLQYCCKALHPLCLRGSSLRLFFLAHVVGIFFTVA